MSHDAVLREHLVSYLRSTGTLRDPEVTRAILAVPRHRFIPGIPLEAAYEDRAVALKETGGEVLSSISQPGMIAQMLELLDVRRGDRVLEIGTGSGYNAALLATLTGESGPIVSVELEGDLAQRARMLLRQLGFAGIDVKSGDVRTMRFDAPFDRIIATARADDIAPSLWEALAENARIVIPLDIAYGGERVFAFERHGEALHATQTQACTFIEMRGSDAANAGDIFFRNSAFRYGPQPEPHAPLRVVAMRRRDVRPEFLERADVIVARQETFFAVSMPSQTHG
ncbi:MAG: protein-L-isoaspartate O-methyltransferase [Candidatus Eremiobacteraeota bacterium]|nr:protein-L-isoaspartate O-methyltransferase [Candidatus Eremiobacteraeota bacterium]